MRRFVRLFFWLATFLAASLVPAATIDSIWSGGATGNWNVAGNWTPSGVPNNGANLYNVNIPAPSAVSVNGNFTIQIFDLDPGASATIQPGQSLRLNASSIIDGTFKIGTDGNFNTPFLRLGADVALSGSGTIEMRGSADIDSPTASRLTIGSGLTIRAITANAHFGEFSSPLSVTNNGTILIEGNQAQFNLPDGDLLNAGTFKANGGANVQFGPTSNAVLLNNSGLFEADNAVVTLTFVNVANTSTMSIHNGGTLVMQGSNNTFSNSGGTLQLDNGGIFKPLGTTLSGGAITANAPPAPGASAASGAGARGVIDMIVFTNQNLILDGAAGGDTLEMSAVDVRIGNGRVLTLKGGFELTDANFILQSASPGSGGTVNVSGGVTVTGTGKFQFGTAEVFSTVLLTGSGVSPLLTLGSGITLETGTTVANSPGITVNVSTAGPIINNNANFGLFSTLTATGPVTLGANSKLTATSGAANLILQNNTTLLGANAEIVGKIDLQGATVSGSGKLRPTTLALTGTNTINPPVQTGASTIDMSGAAVWNGSGILDVSEGAGVATDLSASGVGASLTTGPGIDLHVASSNTLSSNLPFQFQAVGTFDDGSSFLLMADFENDGTIALNGASQMTVNSNVNILGASTGTINVGPDAIFPSDRLLDPGRLLFGLGRFPIRGRRHRGGREFERRRRFGNHRDLRGDGQFLSDRPATRHTHHRRHRRLQWWTNEFRFRFRAKRRCLCRHGRYQRRRDPGILPWPPEDQHPAGRDSLGWGAARWDSAAGSSRHAHGGGGELSSGFRCGFRRGHQRRGAGLSEAHSGLARDGARPDRGRGI